MELRGGRHWGGGGEGAGAEGGQGCCAGCAAVEV